MVLIAAVKIGLHFPSIQAKTEVQVRLEKEGLEQERVWVVHKRGFCLGIIMHESPKKSTALSTHVSFSRIQVSGNMLMGHCIMEILQAGHFCGLM